MNTLQKLFAWLGFDPIALSGAPDGFELLYLVGLIAAFALGFGILSATPFMSAARHRVILLVIFVCSAWLLLFVRDSLTINFIESVPSSTLDGKVQRTQTRIAIPLPLLRSKNFPYIFGSQKLDSATSASYLEESNKPENILAVRATLGLHWLNFVVFLGSLVAASGLALKAVVAPLLKWLELRRREQ